MGKKYRVFHLIKGLGRGGAEVLLREGLRCADLTRFTYGYGYFLPWKDALVPALRDAGADVTCFQSRNALALLSSVPRLSNYLRNWRADLLHCHLPLSGVAGRFAGKLCGIPVVYTEHNLQERYHPWTRRLNLLTWRLQHKVVAVSHEVAKSIHQHAGSRIPVQVVQNGVPVALFQPDPITRSNVRRDLRIPPEAVVVGTIAALRRGKKLHDWLSAASLILQRHAGVHFIIVGDGPMREELLRTSVTMGVHERVSFVGLKDDVIPYLSAMDIYMISSVFEGLPIALLEAMAMRLPVVSTAVGGIVEVVVDGKTGFLVQPNAPELLLERVEPLLGNERLRGDFGNAARAVVEDRFSMKRMMSELEHMYLDILEEKEGTN